MYKYILLLIPILIFFYSCSSEDKVEESCIDESIIDKLNVCIEIYEPVCGCNGVTYPNSCYATTFNGIMSFSMGTCK